MLHVGQVHDVVELEAAQFQKSPQSVLEHEGAVVADVRVVVDRGSAGVNADFARLLRNKRLGLAAQGVVQSNFVHGSVGRRQSLKTKR